MFELAARLLPLIDAGRRLAVATTVTITGSAPRTIGTSMAVVDDGSVVGSLSGGCVEGAVYELCRRVLDTGSAELASYGFSDETAFSVGLACGGRIEVFAHVLQADAASAPALDQLRVAAAGGSAELVLTVDPASGRTFTESVESPARMIVFGAVEFAVALTDAASAVGYRVTVCDPRSAFATPARFPRAAEVVVEWPTDYLARTTVDERTVVCILSHDDRFDADLVALALELPVAYVGAMGSRATHERRASALRERGVDPDARLHSPIGLDLGASTPEETAISILAEVLAVRAGASAAPLRDGAGAIHASGR